MREEKTPDGKIFLSGTMGDVYPQCFEKQKDDAKRFCCILKEGQCEHEATCFVNFQRAINKLFADNPRVIGGHFVFSTDKKKYMSKVPAATMIHQVFEIKEDQYSPVENGIKDTGK